MNLEPKRGSGEIDQIDINGGNVMKDHLHKTSKRMASLLLAAVMTVSMFSPVMAEEAVGETAKEAVVETQTEEAAAVQNEEAVAETDEVSEPVSQLQEEIAAEEPEAVAKEADDVVLTAEDIVNGDVAPEVVLENLKETGVDMAIPESEFTVTRYPARVVIKNNVAKTTDTSKDLYAIILFKDEKKQKKTLYYAERIETGAEVSLYHMYNEKGEETTLGSEDDYTVLLGREYTWEEKTESDPNFGIIGWEESDDKDPVPYNIEAQVDLPASDIHQEGSSEWKDGYKEIKMSATVTANLQVKVTWAPNSKDEKQKTYKKYKLYELIEDPSSETGYRQEQRWPIDNKTKKPAADPASSKSATLDVALDGDNIMDTSLLYMLECYDANGKAAEEKYVTPAAPYFLELQPGYDVKCTQPKSSGSMSYRVQLAKVNKENGGKVTEGFNDDWSIDYRFDEMYSIGDYPVKKKTTEAVQLFYSKSEPEVATGKAIYGRIKTVAFINGLVLASAPSNVLNCKNGPDSCYVMDIAGVIYDSADAKSKSNPNENNKKRAQIHWNRFTEKETEEIEWEKVYLHAKDTGTCAKSGMVFFYGLSDESNIKGYDLLRSDKKNGVYKKVKSYQLNALDLLKLTDEDFPDMPVYAMQYNSFAPEKEFYYAVRAVSKTGSTPGARWEGVYNKTTPDVVQHFGFYESENVTITLDWKHDDCIKQYWVYRSDYPIPDIKQYLDSGAQPHAKVSGGSFKKIKDEEEDYAYQYHMFTDKKKVEMDKLYYYFIRPIDDMSKVKDTSYNLEMCSQVVKAKASAKYTRIKNFTGDNNGIRNIKMSFNQAKGLTSYRIFRLKVPASETALRYEWQPNIFDEWNEKAGETYDQFEERIDAWKLDDWKTFFAKYGEGGGWQLVDIVPGDGKSTGKKTFEDTTVEVGSYYYYLIQGAKESSSFIFSYTKQIRNQPMPVTGLDGTWTGSNANIKIKWSLSKNDKDYSDYLTYKYSKDNGYSWEETSSTNFVDKSLKRGKERTYSVKVVYNDGHGNVVDSKISKIKYSLPSRIDVDTYQEVYVGDTIDIGGRAVKDNGETAAYHEIKYSPMSGALEGKGGHYRADHAGDAYVTLSCAGISKDVHVKVKNR